ncbi:MAG: FAD-dependent oxidoreductase, partial [Holophagales bacterium]|nr:FAD-dependent oxidoreductase [Holophagales bacterium]
KLGPPEQDAPSAEGTDPRILERLRAFVAERLPVLETEPSEVLTCLYTNSPDYHFVFDQHPREPRIVFGTGFSGHGFKFGPIVGEILTSLALGEEPPVDLASFRLSRLAAPAARRKGA